MNAIAQMVEEMIQTAKMRSRRARTRLTVLYYVRTRVLQSSNSLSNCGISLLGRGWCFICIWSRDPTLFRLPSQTFVPVFPLPKWSVAAYFKDLWSIRSDTVILYFLVASTTSHNLSIFSPNRRRTIDQTHEKGWRYRQVRYSLWCFPA